MLLLFMSCAGRCFSQTPPIMAGVVAGVPITETVRTYEYSGRFGGVFDDRSPTRRYVVGGTVGARLTGRFALTADVLYRRYGYDYNSFAGYPVPLTFTHFRGTGGSLEIPLLLKVDLVRKRSFVPYVAVGGSFRHLVGMNETETFYNNVSLNNPIELQQSRFTRPMVLKHRVALAPVVAGGVEFRAGRLAMGPEIRYTRWVGDTLGGVGDPIRWNWHQLDFLIRLTAGPRPR
ncbi:MAG TPA: outer membrane beta-barrel protein [Bryobacteraceae bacterium]|nr:outer membrane beta-barrel protein [Bryobacteraceae bacterium]